MPVTFNILPMLARSMIAIGCLTVCWLEAGAAGLPVTGRQAPEFRQVEDVVMKFLEERHVNAATLAISKDGVILHERAFGYADPQLTTPITTNVCLRIASVSKPITAAGIKWLAHQGKLKLTDRVMKYLPTDRYPAPSDSRWSKITVAQVLDHRGGWDRGAAGDPMFKYERIAQDLKLESLTPRDVVRWMMTQPLQADPGMKSVYSNFGYCLLGVVIEEVTGQKYIEFIRSTITREAGLTSLGLSSSNAGQRSKCETWYDFGTEGERFRIEVMDAHGGLVCTAGDLCRFMETFWINGEPRRARTGSSWTFFGSLPGTTAVAVQRPDGLSYAVLLNKRDPKTKWHEELKKVIDAALARRGHGPG